MTQRERELIVWALKMRAEQCKIFLAYDAPLLFPKMAREQSTLLEELITLAHRIESGQWEHDQLPGETFDAHNFCAPKD